ncbi:MAG: hypothetical protein CR984_06325 [Proteobacteria bacterium]|nr:MAG: hypothetical protein CR984_06325 [Pseudomonadota bacterium]
MIDSIPVRRFSLLSILLIALAVSGCGIASSYRPAGEKTIRDYAGGQDYRKTVGVMALLNNSIFKGDQIPVPFMTSFLDALESTADDAVLIVPGKAGVADFQWRPPRFANGELDVFAVSRLARQAGMNAVVSPVLMDLRVRKRDTGLWLFKDVAYSLQVQVAAVLYDAITGSRLALKILTEEVDIDEDQARSVRGGQEIVVDALTDVVGQMGEKLGDRMGAAIKDSQWLTTVSAVTDAVCVIAFGGDAGVAVGHRFDILDASKRLTGVDGQIYIVPGIKIGEIVIRQVSPREASGEIVSGSLPPVGSIVVPTN